MAKYQLTILSSLACLVSAFSACSADPVSIGEKQPQYSKSELAAYAATWDGYAEAYQFEDKSDRVRLVLDEQGNGTLRLGNRDLIAPPTSPTEFYPPQIVVDMNQAAYLTPMRFWSGFEYAARDTRVESERVRLSVSMKDLFASYCALQTPYAVATDPTSNQYRCLPYSNPMNVADEGTGTCIVPATTTNTGWTTGDPTVEVNCVQFAMCYNYADGYARSQGCTCDANACSVDTSTPELSIDASLDDVQQSLEGTLLLGDQRITIRLQRQ